MTARFVTYRRYPAEWSDEHRSLCRLMERLGIDTSDAKPEWHESTAYVDDVKGRPHGITTIRTAALSNTPPGDGTLEMYEEPDR